MSTLPVNGDSDLNHWIIDAIQDIKGKNIVKLDLRSLDDAPADYFIVCEGDSSTQVKAISDNIGRKLRDKLGIHPNHTEGMDGAKWILVDFFDTVVHVFYPETRAFYEIEDLWSDAKFTQYENI
ncbi:MAG: ribosome silencing factor [Saprospiraceae bacterium]|nr:ribosome silencing factor [Saprospiraceae bacterium]MBK6667810.1 ribosome silencing factor [Saprospiraceae bacterium]MBK7698158.1 ribosome silencing factor [Saprospiraceae bacterium]MBK8827474.1 ribosome silencing factor [Saprospiraceae bacterium]MBK8885311.1 ribosome silencing factor [Saprospiraceae bacterium]